MGKGVVDANGIVWFIWRGRISSMCGILDAGEKASPLLRQWATKLATDACRKAMLAADQTQLKAANVLLKASL